MTSPIRIWTHADHHPVFRCGGWANLGVAAGQMSGFVGGERNTTLRRMELAGLAAALRALAPISAPASVTPVDVHTTSTVLLSLAAFLADPIESAKGQPPLTTAGVQIVADEDLVVWAGVLAAARGRRVNLVRATLTPNTPTAFAAAWAELAKDKAKTGGAFTAAIPKPNLAKAPGLG